MHNGVRRQLPVTGRLIPGEKSGRPEVVPLRAIAQMPPAQGYWSPTPLQRLFGYYYSSIPVSFSSYPTARLSSRLSRPNAVPLDAHLASSSPVW